MTSQIFCFLIVLKQYFTLHCPLTQNVLSGLSEQGVPSFTFPNVVVSPFVVAQLRVHFGEPEIEDEMCPPVFDRILLVATSLFKNVFHSLH